MKKRKYLVAFVTEDGTVAVMGHNKDWAYAKDVCDRHNKYVRTPGARWEIFPLGKSIYPRSKKCQTTKND